MRRPAMTIRATHVAFRYLGKNFSSARALHPRHLACFLTANVIELQYDDVVFAAVNTRVTCQVPRDERLHLCAAPNISTGDVGYMCHSRRPVASLVTLPTLRLKSVRPESVLVEQVNPLPLATRRALLGQPDWIRTSVFHVRTVVQYPLCHRLILL